MEEGYGSKRDACKSGKTKVMWGGGDCKRDYGVKFPCAMCDKGVGSNSILCEKCEKWTHKKCSGVKGSLSKVNKKHLSVLVSARYPDVMKACLSLFVRWRSILNVYIRIVSILHNFITFGLFMADYRHFVFNKPFGVIYRNN